MAKFPNKLQNIRNPFIGCCTLTNFLSLCFFNKKSSTGNATTISQKKFIEKLFFYRFLMNFQRLEFSDDIQPMFVSVLAG